MHKKITRRAFCSMLLALPFPAYAQQAGKIFRIGFLDNSTASGSAVLVKAFLQELSKLGWIEGKNFTIEYRFEENKGRAHLSELAADMVRLKVDLILVSGTGAALAAKSATVTIPITKICSARPPTMSTGFSRGQNLPIFQYSRRRSLNSSLA
jgi:putative ABC transport system substrate-binding protein